MSNIICNKSCHNSFKASVCLCVWWMGGGGGNRDSEQRGEEGEEWGRQRS